jgi:2-(1,2-epoxy-1,2-dihydrophenyl)acetyl-CoA isomerase
MTGYAVGPGELHGPGRTVRRWETLRLEVDGAAARVVLSRPRRHNSITPQMVRELWLALREVSAMDTVQVLVLTGDGLMFCPGADVDAMGAADGTEDLDPASYHVATMLHEMPQVTVAAVNGSCAGAGLAWACACDLRIASARAVFRTAFLDVAVAGDMAMAWTLPRLIGAARARELFFLPDRLGASEALAVGLVSSVVDDDEFRGHEQRLTQRIAGADPKALRTMKANFIAAEALPLREYVELESRRHRDLVSSPAVAAAFRAWVAGRRGEPSQ